MKRIKDNILTWLMQAMSIVVISTVITSCINEADDCPTDTDDGLYISFRIRTRNVVDSRAADISGDLIGSEPENYLSLNQLKFLVYDNDGSFICDISSNSKTVKVTNNDYEYEVTAHLNDPYFVERINTQLDFYILVVANTAAWAIPTFDYSTHTLDEVFDNGLVARSFPIASSLLQPIQGTTQIFPMTGLQRFRFNGNNMLLTTEGMPFDITANLGTTINMLRALAKIEVVDHINIGKDQNYNDNKEENDKNPLRISQVELDGFMNQGRILPDVTQWRRGGVFETQQVINTSIPASAQYKLPPLLNTDNTFGPADGFTGYNSEFSPDPSATALREDKCPVFSCYVYEYSLNDLNGVAILQRPYMRITIRGNEYQPQQVYPLRLFTRNEDGEEISLPQLMRNYIYRFEITGIGQNIQVNWTVCPMDEAQSDIEFN